MFNFTVEVRDGNLIRLGQILPEDLNLELVERFNNVGEWTLRLPITHPLVPALRTPGAGIVVTIASGPLAGATLASGPMVSPEVNVSSTDPGTVTIVGATDDILLADRRAHPAPLTLDPADASHDVRTGPAETLMRQYVNVNLSAGAHVSRRDSRVVVPATLGRGDSMTKRPRFAVLGSLLAEIASGANYPVSRPSAHPGHLGFRLIQVGGTLEFQVYQVANRSAEVRLDVDNGTLSSNKLATAAPTVTHVMVAGDGEGTDRAFVERTTAESIAAAAAWRRLIELLKDARSTDDTAELQHVGDEELAQGGLSQFAIQVTPGEDTGWEFGSDWGLGDLVTVVVRDGGSDDLAATEYGTIVTGFVLKANASGRRIGAILGQPQETDQQTVERRLANLEANAEGGLSLPAGGATGQLLSKASGTDGDAEWATLYTVPTGGTQGQMLVKSSGTNGDAAWGTAIRGDFEIQDTGNTKGYRLRTSGGQTDLEVGGADLYLSTFASGAYTGTQNTMLILPSNGDPANAPKGISNAFPRVVLLRTIPAVGTLLSVNSAGAYVNLGSSTLSYTKLQAATELRVEVRGTFYCAAPTVNTWWGVRIGSTDYEIAKLREATVANAHITYTGVIHISGIAAGAVTLTPRWASQNGGSIIDERDYFTYEVMEIN